MAKNVNCTARLQWKVDIIKNCIYLQCIQKKKEFTDRNYIFFEILNTYLFWLQYVFSVLF